MTNVARTFTRAEAQEILPMLQSLFTDVRALVEELLARRHDASVARSAPHAEGAMVVDEDSAFRIQQLRALLKARLQMVTEMGLEVRRVDGLVDIPAFVDGRYGYFCWRHGDEDITMWHEAHEGCTERRPLSHRAAIGLH